MRSVEKAKDAVALGLFVTLLTASGGLAQAKTFRGSSTAAPANAVRAGCIKLDSGVVLCLDPPRTGGGGCGGSSQCGGNNLPIKHDEDPYVRSKSVIWINPGKVDRAGRVQVESQKSGR